MPFRFNPITHKLDLVDIASVPPGAVSELTGNTGVATPSGGNINVTGQYTVTSTGSSDNLVFSPTTRGYPITPYVVGPVGFAGYQTIQSAINAVNANGNSGAIYIQPGTYNENLVYPDGITVTLSTMGDDGSGTVTINGTHTPPLTGSVLTWRISLISTGDIYFSNAAGSANILIVHNIMGCNGYIWNIPNWTSAGLVGALAISDFFSTNCGILNNTGGVALNLFDNTLGTGTTFPCICSGQLIIESCNINVAIQTQGASTLRIYDSNFSTPITIGGTTTGFIARTLHQTTTSTAIIMNSSANIDLVNSTIDTSNVLAISGSGTGLLTLINTGFKTGSNIAPALNIRYGRPIGMLTPFVVGQNGNFATIQSALEAANKVGGGIVYVQPGTYTENLILYGTTEIVGVPGNSDAGTTGNCVIISGVHTPPATGSFTFANIHLVSATHIFSSAVAGSADLILLDCSVQITSGFTFNLANWTGDLIVYNVGESSTNNGVVTNAGGATCFFISGTLGAGTGQTMSTTGPVILQEIDLNCPWSAATGTTISCDYNIFTKTITAANNSTGTFRNCTFTTGASAAFTMSSSAAVSILSSVISSSNNPSITGSGAGTLTLGDVTFTSNTSLAGTLTTAGAGGFMPGAFGTAGQVLTSNGTGVLPTFQNTTGVTWSLVTSSGALAKFTGSIVTSGALSLSLPSTASSTLGDIIELTLSGGTSWTVTQAASQQIQIGSSATTVGAGGSLASTAQGDTIRMVYQSAGLWVVLSSMGNITVV